MKLLLDTVFSIRAKYLCFSMMVVRNIFTLEHIYVLQNNGIFAFLGVG